MTLAPLAGASHDLSDPLATHGGVPDLVAHSHDVEPVDETQTPRICGIVSNWGQNSIVATPFVVQLRIENTPVNETLVMEQMPMGHAIQLCWTLGGPLARGVYRFTLVADSDDDVPEGDETNNAARDRWFAVSNAPQPDLRVASFLVTPRVSRPGEAQAFFLEVKNAGRAASVESHAQVRDDTGVLGEGKIRALQPGETERVMLLTNPGERPIGNFTAIATLDTTDAVRELNEQNNEAYFVYEVSPRPMPDLAILHARANGSFVEGSGVRLDVTVANQGVAHAHRPIIRLMDGETPIGNLTRTTLAAGANATFTFFFMLAPGEHALRIVLDPGSEIWESNETNNVHALNVTISSRTSDRGRPNLVVRRLDAAPTDPAPGEAVTLNALVANTGLTGTNASTVAFYVDGTLLGRKPLPALRAESFATVAFSWGTSTEGLHNVRVLVDPDNLVAESDEQDNNHTVLVDVMPPAPPRSPPALVPDDGSAPPADPGSPGNPPAPAPPSGGEEGGGGSAKPPEPEHEIQLSDLVIQTKPVPGGLKASFIATLRNAKLDPVPRMSVAYRVDGALVKEVLVSGITAAGTVSVPSGEIDVPEGKHTVTAEARVLGSSMAPIKAEQSYDAQAGDRGIPLPSPVLAVAVAALAGLAFRRRR